MREVHVVEVADELGRRGGAEVFEERRVLRARSVSDGRGHLVRLAEPVDVGGEDLGALQAGVDEVSVHRGGAGRDDLLHGVVHRLGLDEEAEVALLRGLPLHHRLGLLRGLRLALLGRLLPGVQLHGDEAHLLDEALLLPGATVAHHASVAVAVPPLRGRGAAARGHLAVAVAGGVRPNRHPGGRRRGLRRSGLRLGDAANAGDGTDEARGH